MDLIITIFWILLLGSLICGIICLFKERRRLRGLASIFIAPFVLLIAITYFSILEKDRKAQEAGYTSFEAQEIAELDLQAQSEGFDNHADKLEAQDHIKAMALKKALKGFPDEETLQMSTYAGIKRFEAYRLLNDAEAISEYCTYNLKSNQIAEAKLAELDDAPDQAAETRVWEKYKTIQDEGLSEFNSEIGLQDLEYLTLANAGYWNWHCRAAEKGWKVLKQTQAESATRSDAQEAERALTAFYLLNLKNQTSHFFNNERFSVASCRWDKFEGKHFVACQLKALGDNSDWDMYVVGRTKDNELIVAPISGLTKQNITSSGKSEALDKIAKARTYLEAYDEPRAYLAEFAGPSIDVNAVRSLFE